MMNDERETKDIRHQTSDIRHQTLELYCQMLRIRLFEERIYRLFLEGTLPGTIHQYIGQEAVAVGACSCLSVDDVVTSTHRPHGHALAKGVSMNSLMAELFARTTGCCRGRGGSMHVGDMSVGMLPAIATVGAAIPIAAGIALAMKMTGSGRVCACFFGDGAANEGAFHEGLNLAAIWDLPVVFVCENNLYGASTPVSMVMKPENVADRASAYGFPGVIVDGQDVLAVREVVGEAVARARAGAGPTLVECKTYRFCGHSRGDPGRYRPNGELEEWKAKDPIPRLGSWLLETGGASQADLERVRAEVEAEIDASIEYAQSSPLPQPEEALEGLWK